MLFLRTFGIALLTALLTLVFVDIVFARTFPHLVRLADNFSPRYLERTIDAMDGHVVAVLGDSALWGYGISADDAAISILRTRGYDLENLSYEGGSPANSYAVLRLLLASGVRPKAVIFNVNLKEFNAADSAYQKLYPGVEDLAWPLLTPAQRGLLTRTSASPSIDSAVDRKLGQIWALYGMRSDLRYALFDDVDASHALEAWVQTRDGTAERAALAHRPTPDRFEGTYDLSPIDDSNVSMTFLNATIDLLARRRVPAIAILTPTNHTLLHDYIDGPEYAANLNAVRARLRAGGIRVLDYDRRFASADFLDNDHLTVAGNRKLAALLASDLRR